ncbi:C1 family peptidase [Undibacterium sp. Di24W]|uniref:C1 family peptidase n=1 Tax=Undibacterium sp. Di24W TaxID=3413033 RepID=UPI003BF06D30
MKTKHFLLQPDAPDPRDHSFQAPSLILPARVDLRRHCPPVFDQGSRIGSCTANAVCNAYRFNLMRQAREQELALPAYHPSRLFLHYNARALAGKQRQNKGAQIRDAMKSVAKHGICRESVWPYRAYQYATKPPRHAYQQALDYQSIAYQRLRHELDELKACLAEGFPFVFGLTVYSAFESAQMTSRGVLNLPKKEESKVGAHALLAVGYNDESERFVIMNSWGKSWGQQGYFTLPYDYLMQEKMARDFWTLRAVELGS